jgi:hypothetical protein
MSSQNSFQRPAGGRPAANPADQDRLRQPSWVNPQAQQGYPQQPANAWPPQQQPQPPQGGYGQQAGYGQPQAPQQHADYGHWGSLQTGHQTGQGRQPEPSQTDPYAPQFEPYVAPSSQPYGRQQAPAYDQQSGNAPQWPGQGGAADPRGYDDDGYGGRGYPPSQPGLSAGFADPYRHESELSAADWAGQPSEFDHDPYQQQARGTNLGFAAAEGGELEQAYADDDGEYDEEPAPRRRSPMMVMMALAGTILVGGGMAYGYKKMASSGPQGDPPIIKSEDFPSKTKPADAGGKTFPYSDTKIMGRLGDGTSSEPAEASPDQSATADAAPDDSMNGGPRKVSTLVVGRDGSIQSPPPDAAPQVASVPGTSLVDVFGQNGGGGPDHMRDEPQARPNASVTGDDTPAPARKVAVTPVKINGASAAPTGSIDAAATPPPVKKLKKVAKAETATASDAYSDSTHSVAASGGSAGFVAVLASVPHSASSRIDALKRFADMQQKYSTALAGKTPDIATANLGAKGNFDRLVVGPPGSRQEANSVCAQLKAQGYSSCWVTSY